MCKTKYECMYIYIYIHTVATETIEKSLEHPLFFRRNKLLRFSFFEEMKILQLEL